MTFDCGITRGFAGEIYNVGYARAMLQAALSR
jgi:hypothetical protein